MARLPWLAPASRTSITRDAHDLAVPVSNEAVGKPAIAGLCIEVGIAGVHATQGARGVNDTLPTLPYVQLCAFHLEEPAGDDMVRYVQDVQAT